jgi:hypothetical protein
MKRVNGKLVIAITCGIWLARITGASYISYEYKPPARVENWKPEPAQ